MDEKTLKQLTREYEQEMPQEILKIINEFDWKRELRGVVRENNLMLDVGTGLEESVYLMLLGAIKVEDVYDRMIDVHELPEERVQKVLHEIEIKIFNYLSKKIVEIDDNKGTSPAIDDVSRDSLLAEIEDDELHIPHSVPDNIVMPGNRTLPGASMEKASVTPSVNNVSGASIPFVSTFSKSNESTSEVGNSDRLGLGKDSPSNALSSPRPFTLSEHVDIETKEPELIAESVVGVQADPIMSGLTKPTATSIPVSRPASLVHASDPYREPIE